MVRPITWRQHKLTMLKLRFSRSGVRPHHAQRPPRPPTNQGTTQPTVRLVCLNRLNADAEQARRTLQRRNGCGRIEGGRLAMPFTESPVRAQTTQPSPSAVACKMNPRPRLSHSNSTATAGERDKCGRGAGRGLFAGRGAGGSVIGGGGAVIQSSTAMKWRQSRRRPRHRLRY
jgi:hypothetical protein